jgi:hypothetical protein
MPLREKVQERDFSPALGNPARAAGFPPLPPLRRRRFILAVVHGLRLYLKIFLAVVGFARSELKCDEHFRVLCALQW